MTRALPSRAVATVCRLLVCLLLGALLSLVSAPARAAGHYGSYDLLTAPSPAVVRVSGWAFDSYAPPAAVEIHVYIGGSSTTPGAEFHRIVADRFRPDVEAAYAATYPTVGADHGFDAQISTFKSGVQEVTVYALSAPGRTADYTLLGSRTVDIPADTAPPDTVITMGPAATLTPGPVFFEFVSTEPGTFRCAMDDGERFPCESPYAATVTAPGPHTFSVAGVDVFGNVDPLPAKYGFTIVVPTPTPAPGAVSAKAVSGQRKLRVDVDPDWATGDYRLTVQKQKSGTWRTVRRSSTRGSRDVRTIDLRGGRYRVLTNPANGLAAASSGTVRLRR